MIHHYQNRHAIKIRLAFPVILISLIILILGCHRTNEQYPVVLTRADTASRVDVLTDGKLFTALLYGPSLAKPVLFPLLSPAGTPVTRGFPLAPRPGERTDHPHQAGVWLNHGDVNGFDFWNNSYLIPRERKHRYGRIMVESVETGTGVDRLPFILSRAGWYVPDSSLEHWTRLLDEESKYLIINKGATRIIERQIRLKAGEQKVLFRDNKEGFFAIRVARALEMPSDQPLLLTDARGNPADVPVMDNTGVNGMYENSEGITGSDVWAKRARWMKLTSVVAGDSITLVMFDHPHNPGHPAYWHARPYGLFSCNNLGVKALSNGSDSLNLELDPGEEAHFKFRLIVHSGTFLTNQDIENEYTEFIETGRDQEH